MQLTKSAAEKIITDLGMKDMPLIEFHPTPTKVASDWYARYRHAVKQFASSLTDSVETLALMNFSQDEFMNLIMGRGLPQNLSIRLRVPLTWGGEISPENMFACWTFPFSHNLDRFLINQSGSDTIWLPNPEQKIYNPIHLIGGGEGGNATDDRLTQIAAQLAARDI